MCLFLIPSWPIIFAEVSIRNQRVAQAFQPVLAQAKACGYKNNHLTATRYHTSTWPWAEAVTRAPCPTTQSSRLTSGAIQARSQMTVF